MRNRTLYISIFFLGALLCGWAMPIRAQEDTSTAALLKKAENLPPDEYYRARVTDILDATKDVDPLAPVPEQTTQKVRITFLNGTLKGTSMELPYYPKSSDPQQLLRKGDQVVVLKNYGIDMPSYTITDRYRASTVGIITLVFIALVLLLSRGVGARSLIGLAFSIGVIMVYIIPHILKGSNPMTTSLIGALIIALVSLYLAHGFNYRTSVALLCTLLTIALSVGMAVLAVHWARLFGTGSEESIYLQMNDTSQINLQGLLLGGIIVGLLGVLDDITTAQAAVVDELKKANPALQFKGLFARGLSVGKEHIASLINTLALAYVGASFPLLLLFTQYQQPLNIILNNEMISEEIIRTLVGSMTLILAVPITTAIAAYLFSRKKTS